MMRCGASQTSYRIGQRLTEHIPNDRKRRDQQHAHDHAPADPVHAKASFILSRSSDACRFQEAPRPSGLLKLSVRSAMQPLAITRTAISTATLRHVRFVSMGTSAKGKAGPITATRGQAFQPDWGECWVPRGLNSRKHCRAVQLRDQDQGFHGRLPLWGRVLSLRKLRDVVAGILERDELAAARQRYRFIETTLPAAASH